ncbi:MAG TPA: hypothetical protein PLP83_10100 [Candidatus Aminicenantes bacterium]|nr:hypothetical protein [Candidatus Aminicenantes bacterium]
MSFLTPGTRVGCRAGPHDPARVRVATKRNSTSSAAEAPLE